MYEPRCTFGSFAKPGRRQGRDGLALPAALLMVLLIAALVAGAFSAITEETRIGAATIDRHLAMVGAESAVELSIAALPSSLDGSIGVGETISRPVDGLEVPVAVHVTRLDSSLYWLVADAGITSANSGIARRIGVVVRATNRPDRSMTIDRIPERAWSELF